jgi:hypothetical protein
MGEPPRYGRKRLKTFPKRSAGEEERVEALENFRRMDDSIHHLPVTDVRGKLLRGGWWAVKVLVGGKWFSGKKSRSYLEALRKSLDAAVRGME